MLGLLLSISRALEWGWGTRWPALVQVHGQLQLVGFAGLFVMGMALRLMPRFSGRRLAAARGVPALLPLVTTSLVLRSLAQPAGDSIPRDVAILASGVLLVGASLLFAATVCGTVLAPESSAEATAWFFALGSVAYVAGAALNLVQLIELVRSGAPTAPLSRQAAQLVVQHFGFIMLFAAGVVTRAVPALTGRPRPDLAARCAAVLLAAGVAVFASAALYASYVSSSEALVRLQTGGLLACSAAFAAIAWLSGALYPRANRVAAASRLPFILVRFAVAWLLASALLGAWYAARAFRLATSVDFFEIDALRHLLTLGVLTMLVLGMGMLVLPEFAGRRLQHPRERWPVVCMLGAMNASVVLRVWPSVRGADWIASTRYWPMAASGALAELAVAIFALMFLQSVVEQRTPGWSAAARLPASLVIRRTRAP